MMVQRDEHRPHSGCDIKIRWSSSWSKASHSCVSSWVPSIVSLILGMPWILLLWYLCLESYFCVFWHPSFPNSCGINTYRQQVVSSASCQDACQKFHVFTLYRKPLKCFVFFDFIPNSLPLFQEMRLINSMSCWTLPFSLEDLSQPRIKPEVSALQVVFLHGV